MYLFMTITYIMAFAINAMVLELYKEQEKQSFINCTSRACRPCQFHFEHGLLKRIEVGPYQKGLLTDAGLRIGSTRDDVRRGFR